MINEKKPSVGATNFDLSVTSRSVVARLRAEGVSVEEFKAHLERVANFFYKDAFRKAVRGKKPDQNGPKMADLKRDAVLRAVLSVRAAIYLQRDLLHGGPKAIKNYEDAKEVIFLYTGMGLLEKWLSKDKQREELLKVSGKKRQINDLLELRLTGETRALYEKPQSLKKFVSNLFDWMKLVKMLNEQAKVRPQLAKLASSIGEEFSFTWTQERVYLTLIICLTLGTERPLFTLAQLMQFCEKIKHPEWSDEFRKNAGELFGTGNEMISIVNNNVVDSLLAELSKEHNQTVFYFSKKVSFLYSGDAEMLKHANNVLPSAIEIAGNGFFSADSSWRVRDIKKQMTTTIGNLSIANAHDFLVRNPYFIPWISNDEFFRLSLVGITEGKLAEGARRYNRSDDWEKVSKNFNGEVAAAEVVKAFLFGKKLFGIGVDFFIRNRSLHQKAGTEGISSEREASVYRLVLEKIASCLPSAAFCRWTALAEQNGDTVSLDKLSLSRVIAAYISVKAEDRSRVVREKVESQPWSKYLDSNALLFFKVKANNHLTRFKDHELLETWKLFPIS